VLIAVRTFRRLVLFVALCAITLTGLLSGAPTSASVQRVADWPTGGRDIANTRSNPFERTIGPGNAADLTVKWTIRTRGEVSATPAVVGGAVYFPDWAGYFTKADARTGRVIWTRSIAEYTGREGNLSRSSPAVWRNLVFIGDQGSVVGAGARLLAIDTRTGDLVWSRQLDAHPWSQLTQSPMVYDGVVYQGVSSLEEAAAIDPEYPCCTFRGSVVALDARTGRIRWRTYTVPDNHGLPGGYSGAAVWSGTPAIDPILRRVYVTTGNNYTVPQEAEDCQEAGGTPGECLAPDDYLNSILALDMRTGRVVWSAGPERFDAWNGGCIPGLPPDNCPNNPGEDWDFGDGAHLFTIYRDGQPRRVVGAGQKSGEYWLVDARTGDILWSAAAGPGGLQGGIQWGSATDGRRVYVAEANSMLLPHTLPDGRTIRSGSFAALDPPTGRILWQVPDPSGDGNIDIAAVTTANGVLYASSMSGRMFALNAATGEVLWDFQGEAASAAGPAVVDGTVYWGNGYPNRGQLPPVPTPSTFYAFSVPR
jgi:polyvinyl alcohol dehydrogenase (cytochrome)